MPKRNSKKTRTYPLLREYLKSINLHFSNFSTNALIPIKSAKIHQ